MIDHARHVAEDRLLDRYVADRAGDRLDSVESAHLEACPACAARYDELSRFMNELRDSADADTDARFPEARLQAARRQIVRRIEHLGQMARVIAFPAARSSSTPRRSRPHSGTRWIAGAAAAGLLVGVALGAYTDRVAARRLVDSRPADVTIQTMPAAPAAAADSTQHALLDEEAFLREVELASVGLRTRALMPIDAFTPSIQEVSAQLR